ncbi:hypothetical protein [Streptomyces sp. NPDC016675]
MSPAAWAALVAGTGV